MTFNARATLSKAERVLIRARREAARLAGQKTYEGAPCVKGHSERYVSGGTCAVCGREQSALWRKDNGDLHRETERMRYQQDRDKYAAAARQRRSRNIEEYRRRSVERKYKNRERAMLQQAKTNAKKLGLEFSLTVGDIIIPSTCPVLGIPLVWTEGVRTDQTPSNDRIDNTKGYVPLNYRVISWRANLLKRDATDAELILLGKDAQRRRNELMIIAEMLQQDS